MISHFMIAAAFTLSLPPHYAASILHTPFQATPRRGCYAAADAYFHYATLC